MSVSILLYRVGTAAKIDELVDLEQQLESGDARNADLYKMYHELAFVFSNSVTPFSDQKAIEYRVIFGTPHRLNVGNNEVCGFISSSEVVELNAWIKSNQLNTPRGFFKMYDNLSADVLEVMEEFSTAEREDLYVYVKELTDLYEAAEQENNSIVVCAE